MAFTALILLLTALLFISHILYNIFLHPLRHYPGPWFATGSRLWFSFGVFRRVLPYDIKELHDKFGAVVRVAPDELSYVDPAAWQEIYGRNLRQGGKDGSHSVLFKKDRTFYSGLLADANSLVDAEGDIYRPQKKAMAPAFSRMSNISHEDILIEYSKDLVQSLKSSTTPEVAFDIKPWIQNTALDIIVRLTCGLELGAAKTGHIPHPAIARLQRALSAGSLYTQFLRLPSLIVDPLEKLLKQLASRHSLLDMVDFARPLIRERLENGNERTDYISHMLPHFDINGINKNASIIIAAGIETTNALVSSTLYFLLTNPSTLSLALQEIRSSFHEINHISIEQTEKLVYLKACMTEALRVFPPVTGPLPRQVPIGGAIVCGKYVPENMTVAICHWAMNHSERNFLHPERFKPERWLGDRNEIESKALQPFSVGPRVCIGKDLALVNSRLILTHLLWAYDFELSTESLNTGWEKAGAYIVADQRPLFVKIRARV